MSSSYRLPDEPRPGPLRTLVVHPMWPLLAIMFGGVWLSWPWFILNGWALGSPTRVRETLTVLAGLVGTAVILVLTGLIVAVFELPDAASPYLFTVMILWKLGVSYLLAEMQGRGFEVYRYYGGTFRNGFLVALPAAFFLREPVAESLGSWTWLLL